MSAKLEASRIAGNLERCIAEARGGSRPALNRLLEACYRYLLAVANREMCAALRGRVTGAQVFYTLGQLEQKGYLTESDDALPVSEAALWTIQQVDPAVARRRLAMSYLRERFPGKRDLDRPAAVRVPGII